MESVELPIGEGKSLQHMKLSVEAKVAAAVAAGFIALTAAAIGQAGSAAQSGGPNNYGPTDNRCVNTHTSEQGYNSSPTKMSQYNFKEAYKEQNRKAAGTSHKWTDSAGPMTTHKSCLQQF